MIGRLALRPLGIASLILAGHWIAPASGQDAPLRYARVASDGAKILNLADDKGVAVASPARGTLVAIYEENQAGWLAVEIPGGFPVWVFGKYLKPGDEPDVFEVTRNAVNIRPRPASDVTNFPLPQRLHAGDRLRVVERPKEGAVLEDTWVQVWSPPGVRGWLRTSATESLAPGEDGAALWAEALRAEPVVAPPAKPEPVPEAALDEQSKNELARAQELLEAERAKADPDFSGVRAVLEALIADVPTGAVAAQARQELELVATLEEANALRLELEAERARRLNEVQELQRGVIESSRKKDPLGAIFLSRGMLVRRTGPDGAPRYQLTLGGNLKSELFCPSGRYDLDLFAGCEIGVQGTSFAGPAGEPPRIEVARIEVLSRR